MRILFVLCFFCSCMLSNEENIREECEDQRNRAYLYMIPILDRYAASINRDQSQAIYVANTELVARKCNAEAKKNKYDLRTN
ncbi:MAG: hypothetical protein O9264_05475 [Leptospira sp.]|jgi:hypothetical protein|nr:hypothetical protein [Leptospira sp.]